MDSLTDIYNLPKRIKLEVIDDNTIGITKLIKSRIIQKDAKKIVEIADSIRSKDSSKKTSIICTENICSKSIKLFKDNNINIIFRKL